MAVGIEGAGVAGETVAGVLQAPQEEDRKEDAPHRTLILKLDLIAHVVLRGVLGFEPEE